MVSGNKSLKIRDEMENVVIFLVLFTLSQCMFGHQSKFRSWFKNYAQLFHTLKKKAEKCFKNNEITNISQISLIDILIYLSTKLSVKALK